ncbi:hypothetical protein BDN72DRAFT_903841 [Pluteus cervinus]|uniref:Uncharacterized protein n=1 Tax=Pluteus cervinus TaxID=181527 RepID=A0ACD3A7W6_9AGAR|nr:hypothetical protein BDN72DRAFT_903841 [Pluteus cervinus]
MPWNRLQRRIISWIEVQELYIPAVSNLRGGRPLADLAAESIPLLLPSAIATRVRKISRRLLNHEWQYRYAQAFAALDDLRSHLLLRDQLYHSKDRMVRGQRANTRSNTLIQHVQAKVDADKLKYCTVRSSLVILGNKLKNVSGWEKDLRVLEDEDVQGLGSKFQELYGEVVPEAVRVSEGRKKLSWIWRCAGVAGTNQTVISEALRIEWCKTRARAHRWQEECQLLLEEMRRVLAFYSFKMQQWSTRASNDFSNNKAGHRAYAESM